MKKIKYLLAVCAAVLCLGAVSAGATVYTTMADEITLFENMGFNLPAKTEEADVVTRGEFLGTLTQFLNTDFAKGGEYSFTDVPKDSELSGALNYAVSMGIVSDDTAFNPDSPITYPQAMKMAVAFLGRAAEAEFLGGFPSGYTSVASTLKLYSGLMDAAGESVTLRDFYKILYNVGQADMLVRNANGDLMTGNSPFEEYFNLYEVRGIVTASDMTSLNDYKVIVGKNVVAIGKNTFRYEGDVPMGYYVDGWASNTSGDMPKLMLVKPYKNNVTEMSLVNFSGRVESDRFYYESEGKDKYLKIDDPVILYNGIAAPTMTIDDIFDCELGYANFIDNNGDEKVDVIAIEEYRPVIVSITSSMSMKIVDKNNSAPVLLDNNGKVDKYQIIKDGKEIKITELMAGDFLMVYESKNGRYVRVEVYEGSLSGVVSSYSSANRTIRIDGSSYAISSYFNYNYLSKVAFNSKIDVIITPDGVIHALTEVKASTTKYGYIIKWWDDEDTEDLMIKMAKEDGSLVTVKVANNAKLDGVPKKKSDFRNRLNLLRTKGEANLVVKYALSDDEKELKILDTYDQLTAITDPQNIMTGNEDPDNNMKEYNFPNTGLTNPFYNADHQCFNPYIRFSGAKLFWLNTAEDIEEDQIFTVRTLEDLKTARDNGLYRSNADFPFPRRNYRLFNVNRYGVPEAFVYITTSTDGVTASSPRGIVYRVSKAANEYGDEVYEVVLFVGGEYKTFFTTEEYFEAHVGTGVSYAKGDYVRYALDVSNRIVDVEIIYDAGLSGSGLVGAPTAPSSLQAGSGVIATGYVFDIDGNSVAVIPQGAGFNASLPEELPEFDDPNKLLEVAEIISAPLGTASVFIVSADGEGMAEASMGDVSTYMQEGADADFVLMSFDKAVLKEVIIFR